MQLRERQKSDFLTIEQQILYMKYNICDSKNKELSMFSEIALKIYSLVKSGVIKSNAHFWKEYNSKDKIDKLNVDTSESKAYLENMEYSLICVFDENFLSFPLGIKNSLFIKAILNYLNKFKIMLRLLVF